MRLNHSEDDIHPLATWRKKTMGVYRMVRSSNMQSSLPLCVCVCIVSNSPVVGVMMRIVDRVDR